MSTGNPFDLLIDNENDDLSQLIASQPKKIATTKTAGVAVAPAAAKLPSKPLPPAQAVRETRNNAPNAREGIGRGGGGGGGGFGRGGRGGRGVGIAQSRDFGNANNSRFSRTVVEDGDAGKTVERERGSFDHARGSIRGGRRGGIVEGNGGGGLDSDRNNQRRVYERKSGTGRGFEMKREGAGRGNWGTVTDDANERVVDVSRNFEESPAATEKQVSFEDGQRGDASKDKEEVVTETEEKEMEDNEMTLEEYEKVREEKRKALLSLKVEERKVELDKDLQSMQQLSLRKGNDDIFIQLGSDKDSSKRRDIAEKEERTKKVISINEFLKPADVDKYYNPSGRGRGRGRGDRGSFRGGYASGALASPTAPSIADQGQFPTLGTK